MHDLIFYSNFNHPLIKTRSGIKFMNPFHEEFENFLFKEFEAKYNNSAVVSRRHWQVMDFVLEENEMVTEYEIHKNGKLTFYKATKIITNIYSIENQFKIELIPYFFKNMSFDTIDSSNRFVCFKIVFGSYKGSYFLFNNNGKRVIYNSQTTEEYTHNFPIKSFREFFNDVQRVGIELQFDVDVNIERNQYTIDSINFLINNFKNSINILSKRDNINNIYFHDDFSLSINHNDKEVIFNEKNIPIINNKNLKNLSYDFIKTQSQNFGKELNNLRNSFYQLEGLSIDEQKTLDNLIFSIQRKLQIL